MDCAAFMRDVMCFEFVVRLLTFFVLDIRMLNREWAFLMSRSSLGCLASCSHLLRPILCRIFYAAPDVLSLLAASVHPRVLIMAPNTFHICKSSAV